MGGSITDSTWATMFSFVVRATERVLEETCSITTTQYFILLALLEHGTRTMGEVSTTLEIKRSTVSESTNHLEQWGYVVRKYDDLDNRKTNPFITSAGKALVRKADFAIAEMITELWKPLGQDMQKKVMSVAIRGALASGKVRITDTGQYRADTAYITVCLRSFLVAKTAANELGLTSNQALICQFLQEQGKPTSCSTLATSLLMRPNAITVAKDDLLKRRLVTQGLSHDHRCKLLTLTEEGSALAQRYTTIYSELRKSQNIPYISENTLKEYEDNARVLLEYQRKQGKYLTY